MIPLLQKMDHPISSRQVQIEVVDDPQINAGSAGSGQFIVTTGLLNKANDVHLESVLAHEIAHNYGLRHVSSASCCMAARAPAGSLLSSSATPIAN